MTKPADRIALEDVLSSSPNAADVPRRVASGEVFVYPTETIYGIGGRCDLEEVYQRVLAAKKRPPSNPMILIAADRRQLAKLDLEFPRQAEKLARVYWPGPLTLVLPRAGGGTVGVRVSGHPLIAALSTRLEVPLYSTSANISGRAYDGNPEKIYGVFSTTVNFMIDGGTLPASAPSTVVRIERDGTVQVVREGAVPAHEVGRVAED